MANEYGKLALQAATVVVVGSAATSLIGGVSTFIGQALLPSVKLLSGVSIASVVGYALAIMAADWVTKKVLK